MNILMMSNTYLPHVGGVARSVSTFSAAYRARGHKVMVVAPEFKDMPAEEENVVRLPAIQNFNGSDFSVVLPISYKLGTKLDGFEPDIVHSHHPFLVGSTAVRVASRYRIPLVFTHHTMYEQYTHYVPGDSKKLKRFAIELATEYANLCDSVVAPSESIAEIIKSRGVQVPISVIPTGIDLGLYNRGSGEGFRAIYQIPANAFVIGHLGRLAPEKNLTYLAQAAAHYLRNHKNSYFLVVGVGPSRQVIKNILAQANLSDRLILVGLLEQPLLASAYKAMDVFAFSSQSETQGMVITEAMAAGAPVVALDAPGIREVVRDKVNGRLLPKATPCQDFARALHWLMDCNASQRQQIRSEVAATAATFSLASSAEKTLTLYENLLGREYVHRHQEHPRWSDLLPLIQSEWNLLKNISGAATAAFTSGDSEKNNLSDDDSPPRKTH